MFERPRKLFVVTILALAASLFGTRSWAQSGKLPGNPLPLLAGTWQGGGKITPASGVAERISCRVNYKITSDGKKMHQYINCVGTDYKFRATSDVIYRKGGKIHGTWRESIYGSEGPVTGRATKRNIDLTLASDSFTGNMNIKVTSKSDHSVHLVLDKTGTASIRLRRR